MKLDQLIELYMEDRKRLLALPMPEPSEPGSGGGSGAGPPDTPQSADVGGGGGGGSCFVLKPILVDKQLSEPSSPTTGNFRETERPGQHHQQHGKHRQMQRGHSDLGSRVKKRVTLRSVEGRLIYMVYTSFWCDSKPKR